MRNATRVFASLALLAATAGAAHAQFVRCSWSTCDPQNINQDFVGPGAYSLVVSMINADQPNVGHDVTLAVYPEIPDAWRFDDSGCQTGAQLVVENGGPLSKTCPAMRGPNPFPITFYGYDNGTGRGTLRMLNTYDTFDPAPDLRYLLWAVTFDHTYSVVGPGAPGETCGGAEVPVSLEILRTEYLRQDGGKDFAQTAPGDGNPCLWNQSVVSTQQTTLGRVKAQYR